MPSRNTIEIIINAKDNASRVLSDLAGNTQTIGAIATGAIVAGFGAATVAVAGFANRGIQEFMAFEQGMQEVFSLLPGISQDAMDKMTDQVEYLSQRFGVLPEQTIPAMYEALSAGIPQDNVFKFLEVANKAAIAGVTDLETAVNGISSAMNAYGHDVLDAGKASDVMFQTVKLGKTTFEELSNSLYNVSPTAAALGVSFEDLNAQIAAITAQGTPTSVATNQMRQMFVELSKAGGETAETFQQLAGKTFKQFIAEGGNTQDALQLLEKYAKDTGVGINDLFSSVEAGAAALSLTGKNTARFSDFLNQMASAAGSTDEAFTTMSKSLQFQVNRLNARMSILYKTIGEKLAPTVAPLVRLFGDMVGIVSDVIDGQTDFVDTIQESNPVFAKALQIVLDASLAIRKLTYNIFNFIGALNAGVDPMNALFTLLMDFGLSSNVGLAIMDIVNAFYDLAGVLEFITTPIKAFIRNNVKLQDILLALGIAIGSFVIPAVISLVAAFAPIIATFAVLVAGAVLLRKAWEKNFLGIRDKVTKAVVWIETKLTDLRAALWDVLGDPGDDPLSAAFQALANNPVIEELITKFNSLKDAVLPLFREIGTAISKIDFGQLFEIGTTLLSLTSPLGIIKTLFETIFNVNVFDLFIEGINKVTEILANLNNGMNLKDALGIEDGSVISQIIDTIVSAFEGMVSFVQTTVLPALKDLGVWFLTDVLPAVVSFVTDTVIPAVKNFLGFLQRLWTDVSPFLINLANWFINDILPQIVTYIQTVVVPVIQSVIGWLTQIWTAVQPYLVELYNWFINDGLPAITNFLETVVTPIIESLISLMQEIWTGVQPFVQNLVDFFVNTGIPLIVSFVRDTLIPNIQSFIDLMMSIWTNIAPAIESLKSGLRTAFNWIKTNVIDPIIARINEFITTLQNLGIIQGNAQSTMSSKLAGAYNANPDVFNQKFGSLMGAANGLPYVPQDMPIQVHRGERILTKEENANYSGNNPSVVNNYNLSFPNAKDQYEANENSKLYVNALRSQGVDI